MKQKLSRVDRLGQSRRHKANPHKLGSGASQANEQAQKQHEEEIMLNTAVYQAAAARHFTDNFPNVQGRDARKQPNLPAISSPGAEESQPSAEETVYPSRTELYPSHRIKWTKWYFNVLLVIFIGLTIWLLWWGFHESPWSLKQGTAPLG
ncbi:hypothetical protein [Paenibacillus pinistramenti]|uniref:hypothetical protein n=1 Tax=Paenibacillus pinistramenti TaxID=1768003 RepID=UPI0011081E36|nr:hypothetical protein [Paenibacillus pinistramenti]